MNSYITAGQRICRAITLLMRCHPGYYKAAEPRHMRIDIDLSKSDLAGLVDLLIAKGVITTDEYISTITDSAIQAADEYEKRVQAALGNTKPPQV
jgi:hypothetical protein